MNGEWIEALVEVLARTDAVFLPVRIWRHNFPAVVAQARAAFRQGGIAWHGRGDDAAARKRTQTLRGELATAKLIELKTTRKSDKTIGVALTAAGEEIARAAVGLPSIGDALLGMNVIDRLQESPDGWRDHCGYSWVSENELAGQLIMEEKDRGRAFAIVEEKILPLLVRELAFSCTDALGRAWYANGISVVPPAPAGIEKPAYQPAAAERYQRDLKATIDAMMTAPPPKAGELGMIPASCAPPLRGFRSAGIEPGTIAVPPADTKQDPFKPAAAAAASAAK